MAHITKSGVPRKVGSGKKAVTGSTPRIKMMLFRVTNQEKENINEIIKLSGHKNVRDFILTLEQEKSELNKKINVLQAEIDKLNAMHVSPVLTPIVAVEEKKEIDSVPVIETENEKVKQEKPLSIEEQMAETKMLIKEAERLNRKNRKNPVVHEPYWNLDDPNDSIVMYGESLFRKPADEN